MSENRCPCGQNTTPDPSCDMCDGWTNDPDTGWDGYLGEHFNSEEERDNYIDKHGYESQDDNDGLGF